VHLLEQWGNRTPRYIDVRTSVPESAGGGNAVVAPAPVAPASLLPTQDFDSSFDAATRLLRSAQQAATQSLQLSQPIRLADVLRGTDERLGAPLARDLLSELARIQDEANSDTSEPGAPDAASPEQALPAGEVLPPASGQAPQTTPTMELPAMAWAHRPVMRQAMMLADDGLDLPLVEDWPAETEL